MITYFGFFEVYPGPEDWAERVPGLESQDQAAWARSKDHDWYEIAHGRVEVPSGGTWFTVIDERVNVAFPQTDRIFPAGAHVYWTDEPMPRPYRSGLWFYDGQIQEEPRP